MGTTWGSPVLKSPHARDAGLSDGAWLVIIVAIIALVAAAASGSFVSKTTGDYQKDFRNECPAGVKADGTCK